ncbi:MAG: hypothetical protein MK324_06460 [Pirellulales bacterium]|nr:hypothetical protein [Pirellulales bacterium]
MEHLSDSYDLRIGRGHVRELGNLQFGLEQTAHQSVGPFARRAQPPIMGHQATYRRLAKDEK